MITPVRLLVVAGVVVLGGAALALRPTAGTEASAPDPAMADSPPLPAALAEAAKENCDTAVKIEPEAAPLAKFMEAAPCGTGEEGKGPAAPPAATP